MKLIAAAIVILLVMPGVARAQWVNVPLPNIPRTPDGKPNLTAPVPRTPDGNVAAAIAERLPATHVSVSHEVLPMFREYERTSTTVIDAYLSPLLRRYLERLVEEAARTGLPAAVCLTVYPTRCSCLRLRGRSSKRRL